ncbi:MAG: 2-polyprenyl-3-methyl-6-methoxy-1,4-benzoquinone monooxygenase [Gammaproteobacteria bacterium]
MSTSRPSARTLSTIDLVLTEIDHALRTVSAASPGGSTPSPADAVPEAELNAAEQRHAAGLMRINHSGEVCAQALYRGQALTTKSPATRADMKAAACEEEDHLDWCQQRLDDLDAHPSRLNPVWYAASFALGAGAGLVGDRLGLGFVAATEDQVCEHLRDHLDRLPDQDGRSRALVTRMLADEAAHAHRARRAGALTFPGPVKAAMTLASRLMTALSYRG